MDMQPRSIILRLSNCTLENFQIRTVRLGGPGARWADGSPAPDAAWPEPPPGPNTAMRPRPEALIPVFAYLTWEAEIERGGLTGEITLKRRNTATAAVTLSFEQRADLEATCACKTEDGLEAKVQPLINGQAGRSLFNITLVSV